MTTYTMKFSAALALLEQGATIRRACWPAGHLGLQRPDENSKMNTAYLYSDCMGKVMPYFISGDELFVDDWTAQVDGKSVPAPSEETGVLDMMVEHFAGVKVTECATAFIVKTSTVRQALAAAEDERVAAVLRAERAEQTLRNLGYTDEGGMQWKPPGDSAESIERTEKMMRDLGYMAPVAGAEAVDVTSGINDEYVKVLEEQLDRAKAALYGAGFAPCDSTGFWRR